MSQSIALYHWAPTERRKSIIRYGLRPNMLSADRLWRAPYICLADGPWTAWQLIGRHRPHIEHWDLWWTSSDRIGEHYQRTDLPREWRVSERIYKRDLWLVGSRINEHYREGQ